MIGGELAVAFLMSEACCRGVLDGSLQPRLSLVDVVVVDGLMSCANAGGWIRKSIRADPAGVM